MARLEVRLLGPFRAELDGRPITAFESSKVKALLAYLMVEVDRIHPRTVLAGLLWPDCSERIALVNLRSSLSNLRQVLHEDTANPPYLFITHDTVQFNAASHYWLDAAQFARLASNAGRDPAAIRELSQAAALYAGRFLSGLVIRDSDLFEEWALLTREQFARQLASVLCRLSTASEQSGQYAEAQAYARRWLELEPFAEEAHRQLMRSLALDGQRNAALAQYEVCRNTLAQGLDVLPDRQTVRLQEAIRAGELRPLLGPDVVVAPLGARTGVDAALASFVGRKRELARLDDWLRRALAGHGMMVFVSGSAGSGKTALVAEFVQRALHAHPHLTAAWGGCSAPTAAGAAYLPFIEILQILAGQVQVGQPGMPGHELHAARLRRLLPKTLQVIVESAPSLVGTFIPGAALLDCALRCAGPNQPWLSRLEQLANRQAMPLQGAGLQQAAVLTQYTGLLLALARQQPLILFLDDLQWADRASCALLCHLGERLEASRILVVCAYRTEEVATRSDKTGPGLAALLHTSRTRYGDTQVDLDSSAGQEFIGDLLDAEPNRLGVDFRRTLYQHTGGHPLFTVELLRGMQERGDLIHDGSGRWTTGSALNWRVLPTRVEAVVEQRLSALDEDWQRFLVTASVEGEEFSAEVIAGLCGLDEREAIRQLSGDLSQRYRIVHAQGLRRIGDRTLSRYRFRHNLFQTYLYNSLDAVERTHMHAALGAALEAIRADHADEMALDLARHFEQAGLFTKAVGYLVEAGNRAVRLSAYPEAITHFRQALHLLDALGNGPARDQLELQVRIAMGVPLLASQGFGAADVERNYARARDLSGQMPASPQHFRVLSGLKGYYDLRLQLSLARELGEEMLREAESLQDRMLMARAHDTLGVTLFYLGCPQALLEHLEQLSAVYDRSRRHDMLHQFGFDPLVACLSNASWALWILGYVDQGKRRSDEALALAEELAHPPTLAYARFFAAGFHRYCRRTPLIWQLLRLTEDVADEHGLAFWKAAVLSMKGWVISQEGRPEEGLMEMRRGQDAVRAVGGELAHLRALPSLAESCALAGRVDEGLAILNEALARIRTTGMVTDLPEVWRLKGHLLEMTGAESEAETCFREAIAVAEQYQAKSWELRATLSLARLLARRGRPAVGRRMLADVFSWFTEGLDTPDLLEAADLLRS